MHLRYMKIRLNQTLISILINKLNKKDNKVNQFFGTRFRRASIEEQIMREGQRQDKN